MTQSERAQAIEEAARALMDYDVGGAFEKWIEWDQKFYALRAALALEVENYEQSQRRIFGWKGEKP